MKPGPQNKLPLGDDTGTKGYLSFRLDMEEYAIEVSKIKEVIKYTEVTEVPNVTPYIKGVISLRGTVIPVLKFKKYLGFSDVLPLQKSHILIIGHERYMAGLPVDSIGEVINIQCDKVNPVPQFMQNQGGEFFKGIIEYKDRAIIVLKTDNLLESIKNEN